MCPYQAVLGHEQETPLAALAGKGAEKKWTMERLDPEEVKTLVGEHVQAKQQLPQGAVEHARDNHVRTKTFGEQRTACRHSWWAIL